MERLQTLLSDDDRLYLKSELFANRVSTLMRQIFALKSAGLPTLFRKQQITTGKRTRRKKRDVFIAATPEVKLLHQNMGNWLVYPSAHTVYSYKKGISRTKCADVHVGSYELFGIDISDYFPSITESMVYECFRRILEESALKDTAPAIAAEFTSVCVVPHPNKEKPELTLPLGIEPAAALSNTILCDVDERITELCQTYGLRYSRYCDNLYFSSVDKGIDQEIKDKLMKVITDYTVTLVDGSTYTPFAINSKKVRYRLYYKRQTMLGIVVNTEVTLSRHRLRRTRAALHNLYMEARDLYLKATNDSNKDTNGMMLHLRKLETRKHKVFGYLNEAASVNRDKYQRLFYDKRVITESLIKEVSNVIRIRGGIKC